MAGFFGLFNYSKEGPGVKKDAPQKNRFVVFFEIFLAKFWKLILVNLLFVLGLIPLGAASVGIFYLLAYLNPETMDTSLVIVLVAAPMALIGPVAAGITRLVRDFVRSEPVFLGSDFLDTIKKNWKPSLAISAITYGACALLSIAVPFYSRSVKAHWINYIPLGFSLFALLMIIFSQYYLYLMQVTLDLRLKQLIKNALILSIAALFRNFFITILIVLLTFGMVMLFITSFSITFLMPIFFVLVIGLFFALISYIVNFMTFPVIRKYIIDPYYEQHPEHTVEGLEEKTEDEDEENELPEYVYENGRMVHRSVLENQSLFDDESLFRSDEDDE